MNIKTFTMILFAFTMVFADSPTGNPFGLTDEEMHELLKQPPLGPCHGVTDIPECIRWVNDSTTVKMEKHPDYKWEKWRCCCDSVRDSIDAAKAKNRKKKR